MGAVTGATTICLLMGRHYGRFAPYPPGTGSHLRYIYPESLKTLLADPEKMIAETAHQSPASIDEISVEQVIRVMDEVLTK